MSSAIITNHPALGSDVTRSSPALPTTSIPLPKPIIHHGLLIQASAARKSMVTVAGVQVKDLVVHNTSSDNSIPPVSIHRHIIGRIYAYISRSKDDTVSPGEFVARGTIELFGNKDVIAEFAIWHGSPPLGVTVGSAAPSVQRAIIKGSVMLSRLFPSLSKALHGVDLGLQNVSIYHQNYLYDPTKSLGYDLDADLDIDSSFRSLSFILREVLGVKEPTVHIHVNLGPDQSWNSPIIADTFTIEGSFVGHVYAATPDIQITSVSIRSVLHHSPNRVATHDVEVFGTLNLTSPGGSVLPMELDYTLKDIGGTVRLTACLPSGVTWVNPMGAQGFVVCSFSVEDTHLTCDWYL